MITTSKQLERGFAKGGLCCACCGHPQANELAFCPHCQTPADLSRSVAARDGDQRFVSVLGASGAGKTVYLGLLLDLLSKGTTRLRGLATGAFSVALQEQVITALQQRAFPEKTPAEADHWQWVHCQVTSAVKDRSKQVDLVAPDFAGEAIAMEINQSGTYPAIRHVVEKSSGLLLLCDSLQVRQSGAGEDLFAMKLASYIAQLHSRGNDSNRNRKQIGAAVAVVFTKSDACPESREDPAAFAANNMPRLVEFCRQSFARHAFFSASVAGSTALLTDAAGRRLQIPLHVEPHGISEPLEWIMQYC